MSRSIALLACLFLLESTDQGAAQLGRWQVGGDQGQAWSDWTGLSIMMDSEAFPGSIQPWEIKPDENILTRLGPWERWQEPREFWWRPGLPRIWRGNVVFHKIGADWNPLLLLDGDASTGNAFQLYTNPMWKEFYTIDLGTEVPVERFRFYPPDGIDELTGEPFRPGFAQRNWELSASNDAAALMREASANDFTFSGLTSTNRDRYRPLDILLARVENNFAWDAQAEFELRDLRVIRWRPKSDDPSRLNQEPSCCCIVLPDCGLIEKYGISELELYGRGIVKNVTWESKVVDLGQLVNVGQVHFGFSRWRRDGDDYIEAPDALVGARVDVKTGLDDSPTAYYTYNRRSKLVETTESEWDSRLKQRVAPSHPPAVGWRGPITEDVDQWSFWSASLEPGDSPRLPKGRYIKIRVRLQSETLWDFGRLDSLVVITSPLLAERVLGEVAAVGDLNPVGDVAQVTAGEPTELVYEMAAEFSATAQPGFDAVRLSTSADGRFMGLEIGEPPAAVEPDSVVTEMDGFAVYLPQRIDSNGDRRLRLRLSTSMYDAAGEVRGEVFDRASDSLPQEVEPGDVSDEVGTNQLRVVAVESSLGNVLGGVTVTPRALTPQGDGINDEAQVEFTLFSVRSTQVEIELFSLDGRRIRSLYSGPRSAGRHAVTWDGNDASGHIVDPGLYLMRIVVDADEGSHERIRPVAVVY